MVIVCKLTPCVPIIESTHAAIKQHKTNVLKAQFIKLSEQFMAIGQSKFRSLSCDFMICRLY